MVDEPKKSSRKCKACGQAGHNSKTCGNKIKRGRPKKISSDEGNEKWKALEEEEYKPKSLAPEVAEVIKARIKANIPIDAIHDETGVAKIIIWKYKKELNGIF